MQPWDSHDARNYRRMVKADQQLRGCMGFAAFIALLTLALLILWLSLFQK
jgi:hypothetical protein